MKTIIKSFCATVVAISISLLVHSDASLADTELGKGTEINAVKQTVESFCRAEFEGDEFEQRQRLVKFSPARERKEKERTGAASPLVIFWDWDSYYVVSSYIIANVEMKSDKAVATVEYLRLAESKGKERIIPAKVERDVVKLNLVYDGKQWWIFDPPLPRISREAILRIYEDKLSRLNAQWLASASHEQKAEYSRAKHALDALKGLAR